MVDISIETPEQTDERLSQVIRLATLTRFDGSYTFEEFSSRDLATRLAEEALALVRDGTHWSQLVRASMDTAEIFTVFQFHFKQGLDNSGFVGWLASLLKHRFGTGVFVICGQNSSAGGIHDYWGCPAIVGTAVLEVIDALMDRSVAPSSSQSSVRGEI
ncbi:hypothetical protein GR212_33060 [Rhizobium lusitanum]|uniref:Uncharacterized protein n=1 Tax=Rhizobium lusitanum TaxID=293958 RepID=A0A6L9UJW8_9HYPH|nr:DUF6196 family protein [Rhizobium lusitanum]NEI74386.1 hypothetical protein [Rhizobium lusitanum]